MKINRYSTDTLFLRGSKMSQQQFSTASLRDQTIDLRVSTFINHLWTTQETIADFEISLTTTLLVLPVTVKQKRLTLILDYRLGPLLVRRPCGTLMRELMAKNSRTRQQMAIAHHFLGQKHYTPYVNGKYGFVPTAGSTMQDTGWLGFYKLVQIRRLTHEALLIFKNNMKLILPLSHYFMLQRLRDAAAIIQLQKEQLELMVENSGFDRCRPNFTNKLAQVLGMRPEQVLHDETEFYAHTVEVLMVAGLEDFLVDGYDAVLNLDRETIAKEARQFLRGHGHLIVPKTRHFVSDRDDETN